VVTSSVIRDAPIVTCRRPGPFHGRCQPAANSSADLGLFTRSSEVRPDVVDLRIAELTLALADRGVRSSMLRLPPTVHGDGETSS
jgi:hypothetical protein